MCNAWCLEFSESTVPLLGDGKNEILEVGSRDVNGTVRAIFQSHFKKYVGIDIYEGPGVDEVLDVKDLTQHYGHESFDMVVSTEMLEHCFDWQDALYQMAGVLRQNGLMLITTRSPGFELHDYPADHWRFSRSDFEEIFKGLGEIVNIDDDLTLGWPCGIGILVRRTINQSQLEEWKLWLDNFQVYSMTDEVASTTKSSNNSPENMLFDQYSRYKACADLLLQAGLSNDNSLLDIGSGPECLFGQFLPEIDIHYIDPLISPGSNENKIAGDIFSSSLNDRSFDCVSAVDVLEHVPPQQRSTFLKRLSSLGKEILILGFPTSDTSSALSVDESLNAQYSAIYGKDYSWLDEHYRYGLPALSEVTTELERLGWNCRTIGHGHAPWLKELLSFTICAWDIPEMRPLVRNISEQFNRELYLYDFRPPFYRQFVVATRKPISPILSGDLWVENPDLKPEEKFLSLIKEAYQLYFDTSMKLLLSQKYEREVLRLSHPTPDQTSNLQSLILERDAISEKYHHILAEAQELAFERAELTSEVEALKSQLGALTSSKSWKITKPLRFVARLRRYGFTPDDKHRLFLFLKQLYFKIPLPPSVRSHIKSIWHAKLSKRLRNQFNDVARHETPKLKIPKQADQHPDYIIWGVIEWHFRQQRPQHLAQAFAQQNKRVFYISPHFVNAIGPGFKAEALDDERCLIQISFFAEGAPAIYDCDPSPQIINQLRAGVGEFLYWADSKNIASIVQHPFWLSLATIVPNRKLIYDCMDHHEGFGHGSGRLLEMERSLLSEAELTVVSSDWLYKQTERYSRHRTLIRNATDFTHFSNAPQKRFTDPKGRKIIGYYGAIAEWFDIELIEKVANSFPECLILLVGRDTVGATKSLSQLKNVEFTGEVPYKQLPYYLYSFNVCLLPFRVCDLTMATNPVKAYEYLSAGKPIVSVNLPEMAQFNDLVYVALSAEDFIKKVSNVLSNGEPKELIDRRVHFASEQTWTHRAKELIDHIENKIEESLISIIVLTYNNLHLTKECLDSIEKKSNYSNIEIIVVDNASTDETPKFLNEWVASRPQHKVILNEENLGFAAGNNVGLKAAQGAYLVLLNNDTVVTPGWARTLLNHLRRDPSIGVIGPVTNNIGNEAKINIEYSNLAEMPAKAAAYTRRHIGQLLPIRTAAFFCVMFPRQVFEQAGSLDESFGRGFFEDDDYCRRVEQIGLKIVCADDVFVHHHLSASFNKLKQQQKNELFEKNKRIYEAKWGEWVPHSYREFNKDNAS